MAYYCAYNPPQGWDGDGASNANYFSNPDVDYLGLPTGTATENNAKVVRDNMVRTRSAGGVRRCARPWYRPLS